MKTISILGSTGSIGTQTLEVVRASGDFTVSALTAGSNIDLLEQQMREFHPAMAAVMQEEKAEELRVRTADLGIPVYAGMDGLLAAATEPSAEMVVTAVVGMIGIRPTLKAIEAGKDIALANKETLVTAGHLVMEAAREKGVHIYPVDSEHSAIFQSLKQEDHSKISRILLTASGGPFRGHTLDELEKVQVEDALKHPNWSMGAKITIDSSTMVNKALEIIEARWLFDVSFDQIEVVVQPQSVIHSMVEFVDGGIMAQLGTPDMKLPIQYALYEGKRNNLDGDRLDFAALGQITFEAPDMETFRGLKLGYEAGRQGGSVPTVFNAANEFAVARFLEKKIGYLDIVRMIEDALSVHQRIDHPDLEAILETEAETDRYLESRWCH
ncbi:MAG: 1-deoxy-D-xylulose-5-phosphate reductoisomerase [Lachnospiraceae bacterium]